MVNSVTNCPSRAGEFVSVCVGTDCMFNFLLYNLNKNYSCINRFVLIFQSLFTRL